jgi:hypothetical protein
MKHVRSGGPFRSLAEETLRDVRLCDEMYKQFLYL